MPTPPGLLSTVRYLAAKRHEFGSFTVFLFESPKASELGSSWREGGLLGAACALASHRFVEYNPVSRERLVELLKYVFETWESEEEARHKVQFALHFSCHGNETGVQIGKDFLEWPDLVSVLNEATAERHVPYVLSISACGGESLKLSGIAKHKEPLYVFSFRSTVNWADAALAWALLYRRIFDVKIGELNKMQGIVESIRNLGLGGLGYHRWTGKGYMIYPKPPPKVSPV